MADILFAPQGFVSVIDTKTSGSLEVTFISSRITPTCSLSINKLISELFALKAVKYYDHRKDQERKRKLIVLTMS